MKTCMYNSVSAMLEDAAKAIGRTECRSAGAGDLDWAGGRSLRDAIAFVKRGATEEEMKPARELMQKIDSSFRDRETHAWLPSVQGAYPIVPEYLQGMPLNMREQQAIESDVAPIRIFVDPTVSAGVSLSTLIKRGTAIAALAMRMSEERPTELYVATGQRAGGDGVVCAAKLDVAPINLSQCVAVFADASFTRQIVFSHAAIMGGAHRYSGSNWICGQPGDLRQIEMMRRELGITEPDLFIQGGYLPDAAMMERDPVEWVHKQLDKQRNIEA